MNKLWLAAIVVVAGRTLSAQDESSALLARARDKILDSIRRIPKYNCLETIDRTYYIAPPEKKSPHTMTEVPANPCTGTHPPGESALWLDAKDRLRVEVGYGGEDEIHSWPGARFDTRPIDQMIPFGPMSTGSFGGYLVDVFANPGAEVRFLGKETYGGREVFKYSIRVPMKASQKYLKF
ncbi:MAG: hypothetical protein ABSB35_39980 [Bryobacteraceae bacterium]|jgi:hypothetical protein